MKGILFSLCAFLLVACSEREQPESVQEKVGTIQEKSDTDRMGIPPLPATNTRLGARAAFCKEQFVDDEEARAKCICDSRKSGGIIFPSGNKYLCADLL